MGQFKRNLFQERLIFPYLTYDYYLFAIAEKRMECWDCDADDCEGCEKLEN